MNQVRVRKSKIHGHGVFAERDLYCGEVIHHVARSKKYHGYNHSCNPNTVLARIDYANGYPSNIVVVVYRDVPKGTELTVDYGRLDMQCNCELHKKKRCNTVVLKRRRKIST